MREKAWRTRDIDGEFTMDRLGDGRQFLHLSGTVVPWCRVRSYLDALADWPFPQGLLGNMHDRNDESQWLLSLGTETTCIHKLITAPFKHASEWSAQKQKMAASASTSCTLTELATWDDEAPRVEMILFWFSSIAFLPSVWTQLHIDWRE